MNASKFNFSVSRPQIIRRKSQAMTMQNLLSQQQYLAFPITMHNSNLQTVELYRHRQRLKTVQWNPAKLLTWKMFQQRANFGFPESRDQLERGKKRLIYSWRRFQFNSQLILIRMDFHFHLNATVTKLHTYKVKALQKPPAITFMYNTFKRCKFLWSMINKNLQFVIQWLIN